MHMWANSSSANHKRKSQNAGAPRGVANGAALLLACAAFIAPAQAVLQGGDATSATDLAAQDQANTKKAFALLSEEKYDQARALIIPIAARAYPDAQHLLAYLFERGLGGDQDIDKAIELYVAAATNGQADSQFTLGELAFSGEQVVRDYERAIGWYNLAARQGHARAKLRLGLLYAEGLGTEKDRAKAISFFEEAADGGDIDAAYNLGIGYLNGAGVKQNYKKAAKWLEKAARQSHPEASYNLALLYDTKHLGDPDGQKMVALMASAANGGYVPAVIALGLLTHEGRADLAQKSAADWFEIAANAGDAQGQYLYAIALANGDNREKDERLALMWLDRALASEGGLPAGAQQQAIAMRKSLLAKK